MYIVLSITPDQKITINRVVANLQEAKIGIKNVAYEKPGFLVENVSNSQIKIYEKTPGYIYGNYKTLVKTVYIVAFNDVDPSATYSTVVNELKAVQEYRRSQ